MLCCVLVIDLICMLVRIMMNICNMVVDLVYFFFFKQKTAYEMRISDWSSDVCSSDLDDLQGVHLGSWPAVRFSFLVCIRRAKRTGAESGTKSMQCGSDESWCGRQQGGLRGFHAARRVLNAGRA